MKYMVKVTLLFLFLPPFTVVRAQQEVKRDTVYREDGTLWKINEYKDGNLIRRRTYENQKIIDITPFQNGEPCGWSESWDYDNDLYLRSFYTGWGSPRIIDEYSVWQDQKGLARRIVQDAQGYKTHSFYKSDCDSTQTFVTGTHMELRDYKDGYLYASEHYTTDGVPDGLFENYYYSGVVSCLRVYRQGELASELFYDQNGEIIREEAEVGSVTPDRPDEMGNTGENEVKVTKLTKEESRSLLSQRWDSKRLRDCLDSGHDLVIRNAAGEVLLERHSTEEDWKSTAEGYEGHLNFAYYGCDKDLGLHLAYSTYGDYNDVHFFVVPERVPAPKHPEGNIDYMEFAAESVSIHETTGCIAVICGDRATRDYSLFGYRWDGKEFSPVFECTLEFPVGIPNIYWIDDNSFLVSFSEEENYQVDMHTIEE